jgi:hypothetical protein
MIVIRGVDDEASLALAIGSLGARIGRLVSNQVIGIIYGLMTSLTLFAYGMNTIGIVIISKCYNITVEVHWLNIAADVLFIVVLTVPIVFRIVASCCKMFSEREFFLNWQHFEIAAGTTPDSSNGIPTTTLPPISGSTGLRHLIYDHPDCAKAIVNWLIRRTTASDSKNDFP